MTEPSTLSQTWRLGALIVFGILISLRVLYLDYSPPGFYVDEAGSAAHVMCLKETGENCRGQAWTLYSTTWGVGRTGPVYQYTAWLWTELFGGSITSFRMLSAVFGILTLFVLYKLCLLVAGPHVAGWTMFGALLLPWGFHSARIAWDPPLTPLFAIATAYFVARTAHSNNWIWFSIAAALSAVLGGLAYAPALAHIGAMLLLLFVFQKCIFPMPFRRWLLIATVFIALVAPVRFADTSAVEGRAMEIGIFGDDARNPTAGQPWTARILQFGENIAQHFEPKYLFWTGDFNYRHTTSEFGIFSWLDMVAIGGAILLFMMVRIFKRLRAEDQTTDSLRKLFLLGFIGYLTCTMAASLTWDSLPHGLRTISGWPFAALFAGVSLSYVCRFWILRPIVVLIGFFFIFKFHTHYFGEFRTHAAWWFDSDVADALENYKQTGDKEAFKEFFKTRQYPSLARKYYFIQYLEEDAQDPV